MQTLEVLDKKIRTAEDLLSVVKSMKTLSAVNIRHYEMAVESLEAYRNIVDKGWQILFSHFIPDSGNLAEKHAVIIVIGTDQGMCGQFNEIIAAKAMTEYKVLKKQGADVAFWSVGEKVAAAITDENVTTELHYNAPGSLNTVNIMVADLTEKLENRKSKHGTDYFYLCHNILSGKTSYDQTCYPVLPLDKSWVDKRNIQWPERCLPLLGLPPTEMFRHLFRQYLYISLYRALVQSLAGENLARLTAMQAAEKNIEELEADLKKQHREERQAGITNELLDIISGFEALSDDFS
ncbi:MAG: F0F1 ATP synthase subunit gamma [Proteobacteria bacterium]|nr:F0F1 ATP synthase subunit gamma [Pseudomonadota bacterium]